LSEVQFILFAFQNCRDKSDIEMVCYSSNFGPIYLIGNKANRQASLNLRFRT